MRVLAVLPLVACIAPSEGPPHAGGEVAIYRIPDGDCLSAIADRIAFPGGWRALAAANNIRGDFVRASAGLRVPIDYLRRAGIDPYRELGFEPLPERAAARRLAPCAIESVHGACIDDGDRSVCLERTPPRDPVAESFEIDDAGIAWRPAHDGVEVVVYRGGARVAATTLPNAFDPGDELDAIRADLDGDGRPELVVAQPMRGWNHLGLDGARVLIIAAAGVVQLDVDEWGDGSLIASDDGRGCELLATTWDTLHHPIDPAFGTYLVGRPMRYDAGALVPRGDEVVRRMRTMFHALDDGEQPRPAEWLSARDAEWWPELAPEDRTGTHRAGTIAAIAVDAGAGALVLELALDDGERVHVDAPRLGSIATGMLFPERYVPADPSAWLGARVLFDATLGDERYVWL